MKKTSKERSLAFVNQELTKEWHYKKNGLLIPEDVSVGSDKKVWWKCKKGHEWQASLFHRGLGTGCPYCSNKKVCKDNCLSTSNPELAEEWNYKKNKGITPNDVVEGSNKKVWWKCKKGHEWKIGVNDRVQYKTGCPYCSNQKPCKDNCLATVNPELANEWHSTKNEKLTPHDITCGSKKKAWWACEEGHEWNSTVDNRNRGRGCPVCRHNKIELKDGMICDSLIEAYYYLELKKQKLKFKCQVKIGIGRCSCDFYIPSLDKYIEVTSYDRTWKHWSTYHKNILKKKKHITKKLKADFEFVHLKLTPNQTRYVRNNSV